MSTIMTVNQQWRTRPADQRFTSLTELQEHVRAMRQRSIGKVLSNRALSFAPIEGDNDALVCVGPNGGPVSMTNWSFGQVCQRAGFPVSPLRELPTPMVADILNYKLHHQRDIEEIGVLLHKPDDRGAELRAVTGPNYGRIWNQTIVDALVNRFGDGVTGAFRVPGEFGKPVPVTKDNTTIYGSDRDMFVFLADETHRIDMANRRNGQPGSLARGFIVWNSETGSSTFGIATMLFDYVCCNRIIWGAQEYAEIRVRHTAGAPDRWVEEVAPAIEAYAQSSTRGVTQAIAAAQAAKIDDVDEFLRKRFSSGQVSGIKAAHMADEQRPIETLWDAATGVTAYARGIQHQNERVVIEREGGKILAMAA